MALYPLDVSSDVNMISSIKAACVAAGIVDTEYYVGTTDYIAKLSVCDMVVRFRVYDVYRRTIFVFVGTSYVSGTTIANAQKIMADAANSTYTGHAIIATSSLLAFGYDYSSTYTSIVLLARGNDTPATSLALGWYHSPVSSTFCFDCTNRQVVYPVMLYQQIKSTDGYYYTAELPIVTATRELMLTGLSKVKQLLQPRWTGSPWHIVNGDDVILPGGSTNNEGVNLPLCFLLEDAAL